MPASHVCEEHGIMAGHFNIKFFVRLESTVENRCFHFKFQIQPQNDSPGRGQGHIRFPVEFN